MGTSLLSWGEEMRSPPTTQSILIHADFYRCELLRAVKPLLKARKWKGFRMNSRCLSCYFFFTKVSVRIKIFSY